MVSALKQFLLLVTFICLPTIFLSQTVSIDYDLPTNLTVCDSTTFSVTITNNTPDSVKILTLTANMPDGIFYLMNSAVNATESNITDLNVPILGLPNLGPGDIHTFTFNAQTSCDLIEAIDSGALFENVYTANWDEGTNSQTTLPYDIETALLQILSVTNQVMQGTTGDILTRTITIQNTRLGALSKITFTDTHTGGTVELSTDLGMVSLNSNQVFQVMLTADDFMTIGDGDGLFELNEIITITETILITDCGFDENTVNSIFNISWGCNNEICQQQTENAMIELIPSNDNPNLLLTSPATIPSDFCAGSASPQSFTLTNVGGQPATNILMVISHEGIDNTGGADPSSFQIDSNGIITVLAVEEINQVTFGSCGTPLDIFDELTFTIPSLGVGESITVLWDSYFCSVGCGTSVPFAAFAFEYDLTCPEGEKGLGSGSNAPAGSEFMMLDSVTYFIGEALMDDMIYTMNYHLISNLIEDSTGNLILEFNLPCGIGWVQNNSLLLGGEAPQTIEIEEFPNGTSLVTALYSAPLTSNDVNFDFQITFDCDVECLELPECDIAFNTSCPADEICSATGPPASIGMSVLTTFNLDTLNTNACGIQECEEFVLVYDCPADSICEIPIIGYLDYEMDTYRENLGQADNDDDRFEDPDGEIDLDLIRRDRAMPGDFIKTEMEGAMVVDIPGESLSNGFLTVQFEAHTIDEGIDMGEVLDFDVNNLLMTEEFGFQNVEASIRIVDAETGESYTCPLGDPGIVDTLYARIEVVNTRQPALIDEILFMTFTYDISPASLSALGSNIPAGFEFEEGDSIIFESLHKVTYNVIKGGTPRIVNLRTGTAAGFFNVDPNDLQQEPFVCNCQSQPWQLTGYRYIINPGLYNMPPCDISEQPGGARFDILLGKGNFFPFEFRNLASIIDWDYTVPAGIELLDSELLELKYQDGPLLASNTELVPTPTGNTTYIFDLEPFQEIPLDEGFSITFRHLWDVPCTMSNVQPLEVHALLVLNPTLPEPENPLDTTQIGGATFNLIRPVLFLQPDNINDVSFSNIAQWEFDIANFPAGFNDPAPNVWIMIDSPDGTVQDFSLFNVNNGQTIQSSNNIFQLGDFDVNLIQTYQLTATNNSCIPTSINITYGWNCEPFLSPDDTPCSSETIILTVESPIGEIEMDVESPIGPFNLCDTIPYHTVEIFNAQMGAVFNVTLDAILPEGISIVPGSSEIAYPTGTGFIPTDDPIDLGNGNYSWMISELNSNIGNSGLAGFQFTPEHSVSIRFLTNTECGFIAGSFIEFTAKATQNCDEPTNELSKASNPLLIEGVELPYETSINIDTNAPPVIACGDDFTFTVNLQADGITLESDSVFVFLPEGANYVAGSYNPISNAVTNEPSISNNMGQQVLKWEMLPNLPSNTDISFELTATNFSANDCESENIEIKTFQKQEAICVTNGELCSILVETGASAISVTTDFPILNFDNLDVVISGNGVDFNLIITNSGAFVDNFEIDFYLDNDGDGQLSNGDDFVNSINFNLPINPGETVTISDFIEFPIEELCNFLVVLNPDKNCGCNEATLGINEELTGTLPSVNACNGETVQLGIEGQTGHTYSWTPAQNLSCTDCPNPTFQLENSGTDAQTINYNLIDESSSGGCILNLSQLVIVQPTHEIIEPETDVTICLGETLDITATSGAIYNWNGPNIITENDEMITVEPTENSIYTVEIQAGQCSKFDTISVNVIGDDTVIPTILCPGDSVVFDNVTYFEDTMTPFVDTIFEGCITNLALNIDLVDTVNTGLPIEICLVGDETFQINLNDVFQSYTWIPNNPDLINCVNCPNPIISPQSAADSIFTVIAIDQNGCEIENTAFVNVLPPCSSELIDVPNAFTPNGDGTNDTFGPVIDDNSVKIFEEEGNSLHLRVWNRWGQKVFEGFGPNGRWDGMQNNKAATGDLFIYSIEVGCEGNVEEISGDVTMIR